MADCDLIDLAGVAKLIGKSHSRAKHLNSEGKLPTPDRVFGKTPVWERAAIERWATETGRMPATTKEER